MSHPDPPSDVEALARLNSAGWSVGEFATTDRLGRTTWLVSGSNGENLIRAEGPTRESAWALALDQARAVGMLGRG